MASISNMPQNAEWPILLLLAGLNMSSVTPPPSEENTTPDKLKIALDLKQSGNELYKEGSYKKALRSYHK